MHYNLYFSQYNYYTTVLPTHRHQVIDYKVLNNGI